MVWSRRGDKQTTLSHGHARSLREFLESVSGSVSADAGRRRKGGERRNDCSCGFVDLRAERSTGWSCDALTRK